MAAKAHCQWETPALAISTNDGLGLNAKNIGTLLATRHVYFVPFGQDDPIAKPTSLFAFPNLIKKAAEQALQQKQLQPLLRQRV